MKKLFILLLLFLPLSSLAQEAPQEEEIFKAKVIEVIQEQDEQQNLKLQGLEGSFEDQEIIFEGIGNLQVAASQNYEVGDKVIVSYSGDFYVLDYDRSSSLWWLIIIFVLSVLAVGKWKGLRSLLALVVSFFVILKFVIPQILAGHNPVLISVIAGLIILLIAIYLTHGFNKKSHITVWSLSISLLLIAVLSFIFTKAAQLTGYLGEETLYLLDMGEKTLSLQGLLLAGILIGTLGILDDVIVSQVSAVEQIKKANSSLSNLEVYKRSFKVGIDHITSMINTLFFAYAGVSLPLLILFTQSDTIGLGLGQAMNNEIIATEIVRTLLGSIGIVLSIPIANYLASYFLKVKE